MEAVGLPFGDLPAVRQPLPDMIGSAVFSPCGTYRYELRRVWGKGAPLVWLMLNPSTADAYKLDPTITRCVRFAKRWGYPGIIVANLFPFRSPHPSKLAEWWRGSAPGKADAMVENFNWIGRAAEESDGVIVAFGAHPLAKHVAGQIEDFIDPHEYPCRCLGHTGDFSPLHPLARGRNRVPDDIQPIPWQWHRWQAGA